ncbi:MAG: Smr/MutS family protein [Patescibacteria group bacterium]|nr:Smr/MutS family protein [Patescibacteria group bacterium]MDD5490399.1 Smr/MutS family protein [Patescibacteria group bacterium]
MGNETKKFKDILEEYGSADFSQEKELGELEYRKNPRHSLHPPIGAELDLHGQRVRDAILNLKIFIKDCQKRGVSRVLIITGRGEGILREVVGENLAGLKDDGEIRLYKAVVDKSGEAGPFDVKL